MYVSTFTFVSLRYIAVHWLIEMTFLYYTCIIDSLPDDSRSLWNCKLIVYAIKSYKICVPFLSPGQGQANMRTRMIITATMTCDSPCVRHNSTLQTLSVLQDNLLYLRTAAQQRVSVNLNIGGVNILMWFFDGRRSIVSTCEGGSTTSVIKGLSLCGE